MKWRKGGGFELVLHGFIILDTKVTFINHYLWCHLNWLSFRHFFLNFVISILNDGIIDFDWWQLNLNFLIFFYCYVVWSILSIYFFRFISYPAYVSFSALQFPITYSTIWRDSLEINLMMYISWENYFKWGDCFLQNFLF